jgi:hypothetical protein
MKPARDIQKDLNFECFKACDYSWSGYQHLEEISKNDALSFELTRQSNWVGGYLVRKGIN